ncbi:MAG: hypothetical protein ACR2P0_09930 [Acidimicrobiales bacterium]
MNARITNTRMISLITIFTAMVLIVAIAIGLNVLGLGPDPAMAAPTASEVEVAVVIDTGVQISDDHVTAVSAMTITRDLP